jgi:hypothetical protein
MFDCLSLDLIAKQIAVVGVHRFTCACGVCPRFCARFVQDSRLFKVHLYRSPLTSSNRLNSCAPNEENTDTVGQ